MKTFLICFAIVALDAMVPKGCRPNGGRAYYENDSTYYGVDSLYYEDEDSLELTCDTTEVEEAPQAK